MCRGQCTIREGVLAGLHISVVVISVIIAVLLAVNKLDQNAVSCPYARRYDETSYDSCCSGDALCDTGLYWALMSAALAFLFVMVNWVAGVHKSLQWQRVQFVLTIVGVAGMTLATVINTSGVVLWCQNLTYQRTSKDTPTMPPLPIRPKTCYEAAVKWDAFKAGSGEKGNKATDMYNLVIPAEAFHFMTLILWHIMAGLTFYVTYYRIEEHQRNLLAMEAEEDSDTDDVRLINAGPADARPQAANAYPYNNVNKHI